MSSVKQLIEIAQNEIGYFEKKNKNNLDEKKINTGNYNYTKYARDLDAIADFYNGKKQGYAWCDVFVDWCFVKTFGVERAKSLLCQPNKSLGAGVGYSKRYYVNKKQYYKSAPEVGDQIFFKNGSKITHTGLVYKVDKNYVYTIEGNTSNSSSVVANGEGVFSKKYRLNSLFIDGYGRPNYSKSEKDVQIEDEPINIIGKIVKYVSDVDYEGLVVHTCPDGPDKKIIPLCTKVYVYETKGQWSRIGEEEWVYSEYLKDKKPTVKKVTGADKVLNVRASQSKNSKLITSLPNGTIVQVFKTYRGWSKISPDEEAWVSSNYLK